MPADREQSPVHEPGDDDGATAEAEGTSGSAEEDELEGVHGRERVGRGDWADPARREWRRGGRPCTRPVYERSGGRQARERTDVREVLRIWEGHGVVTPKLGGDEGDTAVVLRNATISGRSCQVRRVTGGCSARRVHDPLGCEAEMA